MKMYIAIEVRGDRLDPTKVTSATNVVPSFSSKNGEVSSREGRPSITANTGSWRLYSSDIEPSTDINLHVLKIRQILSNCEAVIASIEGVERAWIDIFLSLRVEPDKSLLGGVLIDRALLKLIERHHLEILVSYDAYLEGD